MRQAQTHRMLGTDGDLDMVAMPPQSVPLTEAKRKRLRAKVESVICDLDPEGLALPLRELVPVVKETLHYRSLPQVELADVLTQAAFAVVDLNQQKHGRRNGLYVLRRYSDIEFLRAISAEVQKKARKQRQLLNAASSPSRNVLAPS